MKVFRLKPRLYNKWKSPDDYSDDEESVSPSSKKNPKKVKKGKGVKNAPPTVSLRKEAPSIGSISPIVDQNSKKGEGNDKKEVPPSKAHSGLTHWSVYESVVEEVKKNPNAPRKTRNQGKK